MLDRTAALLRDVPRRRVNHSRSVIRAINDIHVGKRHRRDMGDIAALAQEIAELGLLHPIVVNHKNQLIAGVRRLEACKLLGLTDIAVTVVNLTDITRASCLKTQSGRIFCPVKSTPLGEHWSRKSGRRLGSDGVPGSSAATKSPLWKLSTTEAGPATRLLPIPECPGAHSIRSKPWSTPLRKTRSASAVCS